MSNNAKFYDEKESWDADVAQCFRRHWWNGGILLWISQKWKGCRTYSLATRVFRAIIYGSQRDKHGFGLIVSLIASGITKKETRYVMVSILRNPQQIV